MSSAQWYDGNQRQVLDGTLVTSGGSQPGGLRRVTFDVDVTDVADGPVLLYTPTAGEVVCGIAVTEWVALDTTLALMIAPLGAAALVAVTTNGGQDVLYAQSGYQAALPKVGGFGADFEVQQGFLGLSLADLSVPIYAGLAEHAFDPNFPNATISDVWKANTAYGADNDPPPPGYDVLAAGSLWFNEGTAGTSGISSPDFAGGTPPLADGPDITWDIQDALPGTGHITGYLIVANAP